MTEAQLETADYVVDRFVRGANPRLWINRQEVGRITDYHDPDQSSSGKLEILAGRVWRSYNPKDLIAVTWR
jgi:hypothetical protein